MRIPDYSHEDIPFIYSRTLFCNDKFFRCFKICYLNLYNINSFNKIFCVHFYLLCICCYVSVDYFSGNVSNGDYVDFFGGIVTQS